MAMQNHMAFGKVSVYRKYGSAAFKEPVKIQSTMTWAALVVLGVIIGAIILFATEALAVDLVALLIIGTLVLSGVLSPQEGVSGFSNPATLTVAFMFALGPALLKTGAFQYLTPRLMRIFKWNFLAGISFMMLLVAFISAFINNTPVVAVLIPVVIQLGHRIDVPPSKLLIPLSFASIFGGTCSLIGTSTNILVSGIATDNGLPPISMFFTSPMGLTFTLVGTVYMVLIGIRLLPSRKSGADWRSKFGMRDYLTEIELLPGANSVDRKIMDSPLVEELEMDIIEIRRNGSRFTLPPGDMVLKAHDTLKVRCNVDKMARLKERIQVQMNETLRIGDDNLRGKNSTIIEMVITANSDFEGKTLRALDFRRQYRAVPLAIVHREEVLHDDLHDVPLKAGDLILAEVKTHFLDELKRREVERESPFIILSESGIIDFNQRKFLLVLAIIAGVVLTAALQVVPIMIGAISGVALLILTRCMSMSELYESINWKVVFLLAGALSLGVAMQKSGLADQIATGLVEGLGPMGPRAILAGIGLTTILLTETMSNNATAALMAPIAIATANTLGVNHEPLLMAVVFGASTSFLTPVGYQTNTMIYTAGEYRFLDFMRVGFWLDLLFWLLVVWLVPVFYPF